MNLSLGDLNPGSCLPHHTSTYICGVTTAPRVCSGINCHISKSNWICSLLQFVYSYHEKELLLPCVFESWMVNRYNWEKSQGVDTRMTIHVPKNQYCITCINLFIAYHKNDLKVLMVMIVCSISKSDRRIERYPMIKFARSTCIVSR